MTTAFTIPNATLLAVAQVGVIVAGALGAAVSRKIVGDAALPWLTLLFTEAGIPMLLIPLFWLTSALLVRRNPKCSDGLKGFIFAGGFALLLLLVLLGLIASVRPFLMSHAAGLVVGEPE